MARDDISPRWNEIAYASESSKDKNFDVATLWLHDHEKFNDHIAVQSTDQEGDLSASKPSEIRTDRTQMNALEGVSTKDSTTNEQLHS